MIADRKMELKCAICSGAPDWRYADSA
jgi:hypothetical protein